MKRLAFPLTLALFAAVSHAQISATFTFGPINPSNCSAFTAWNGVSDAYPEDMGQVCFNFYPDPYSSLELPWQLGFPNNGFLENETPFTWSAPVFTSGNGTTNGSTFYQNGTAAYTGYGAGVNVSVTADFTVHVSRSYYRGVCRSYVTNTLTGGTGTVTGP